MRTARSVSNTKYTTLTITKKVKDEVERLAVRNGISQINMLEILVSRYMEKDSANSRKLSNDALDDIRGVLKTGLAGVKLPDIKISELNVGDAYL